MADTAAVPSLGSTLLLSAEKDENCRRRHRPRASCGAFALDEAALEGGFGYGEITSISGASGTRKTLLVYHALASHLLAHPRGQAAFIDTTGSFSPWRFRDVMTYRLRARQQRMGRTYANNDACHKTSGFQDDHDVNEATSMMDRVGVMRVFDLTGVIEAVREIGTMSERVMSQQNHPAKEALDQISGTKELAQGPHPSSLGRNDTYNASENASGSLAAHDQVPRDVNEKQEIGDSEEETDDEDLLDIKSSSDSIDPNIENAMMAEDEQDNNGVGISPNSKGAVTETKDHSDSTTASETAHEDQRIGMIIIDTITNVVSSVVTKSPTQGQALQASFMQSLHYITTEHHICTLLTNTAVGLSQSTESGHHHHKAQDNISIFSSTVGRPALGRSYATLIDTSVFLSTLPRSRDDAATAYGDRQAGETWQKALVMEVAKDRHGPRMGRWGAFIVDGVRLIMCAK